MAFVEQSRRKIRVFCFLEGLCLQIYFAILSIPEKHSEMDLTHELDLKPYWDRSTSDF